MSIKEEDICNFIVQDNEIPNIESDDLENNQYSEEILIHNINKLFVSTILRTQKNLSIEFIDNFILNEKYQVDRKEKDLTIYDILKHQPHYAKRKDK